MRRAGGLRYRMLDTVFFYNSLRSWTLALGTALAVFAGLQIARRLVLRYLAAIARRTRNQLDDVVAETLRRTTFLFLLFLSVYAGSRVLLLPETIRHATQIVGVLVLALQVMLWGNVLITSTIQRQMRQRLEEDPGVATTINALGFVGRLALYVVVVLVALDNLGVDITALVTGLGIGGIAVALALQNVLGDLFGSLSIVLDRPFVIGDFIIVGDMMGTVEYIGLKTTRVRSLSGEQLVFSNSDLLSSRIRNFKRMQERRIVFKLGVTYDTPRAKLELIPALLRDVVESREGTRFDRAHFASYGAFSLDFEVVYYVLSADYNAYMDTQQAINFGVHRRFGDAGVEFAFPTQTIHVAGAGAGAGDGPDAGRGRG